MVGTKAEEPREGIVCDERGGVKQRWLKFTSVKGVATIAGECNVLFPVFSVRERRRDVLNIYWVMSTNTNMGLDWIGLDWTGSFPSTSSSIHPSIP